MKKAILYLRFSDIKQAGGTSIEVQEEICRNACKAEEYEVVDVIKNEAVTASKTNVQRVAELLEFCKSKQGKFDVLMVYKLDRFARSQEQHHWLRGQLLKMKIILRSATEKIDESPSGRLVEGVLAAVNEYDNEVKRERVKLAMWARVDQGLWPWNPAWGYMPNRIEGVKLGPHSIDKTCSDTIEYIFSKYSTGLISKMDLARSLSKRKIYNYKKRRLIFNLSAVCRILNNRYYCGQLTNKDGAIIKGLHEPIISVSLFEKCQFVQSCQERNANSKRMYNNPDFPLRRFIFCNKCGKAFTACWSRSENGEKHPYYYCHNKNCKNYGHMVKREDIENQFMDYLKSVKPTDEFIERFKKRFIKRYEERKLEIKGDYLNQIDEIKSLENEQKWIVEKAKKGVLPDSLVKEQLAELENKLTLSKMELSERHDEELDVTSSIDYAEGFIRTMDVAWFDAPLELRQKIQRAVFPNGITYEYPGYSNSKISPVFEVINTIATSEEENVTLGRIELPSHP